MNNFYSGLIRDEDCIDSPFFWIKKYGQDKKIM